MKLYLHNFLQENSDGTMYYPLHIVATEVGEEHVEINQNTLQAFFSRVDIVGLQTAIKDLGLEFEVPASFDMLDDDQIQTLHHILFEIEVISGELVSPSGRHFPIVHGIPDMCPPSPPEHAPQEPAPEQ